MILPGGARSAGESVQGAVAGWIPALLVVGKYGRNHGTTQGTADRIHVLKPGYRILGMAGRWRRDSSMATSGSYRRWDGRLSLLIQHETGLLADKWIGPPIR